MRMNVKIFCAAVSLCLLLLLISPAALANGDAPTVAFLRFGTHPVLSLVDKAVLDMLEVYGYVSAEERATLEGGGDLHGEHINILNRDAGFDFPTANLMVEDALDEGADILLTVSNEVGAIAASAIGEMDEPPAMIFAIVTAPDSVGIVQSSCIKPANVTGTQMVFDQELSEQLIFKQDPDLDAMGILVDVTDSAHFWYIEGMEDYAERTGIRLEIGTGATASDWQLATQSLMNKDVDAIALVPRTTDPARGIASVVLEAYGVPVYSSIVTDALQGVTIAAGFHGWYNEGQTAARMVIAHLRGELDIAATGVARNPATAIAVNLDTAAEQGVDIAAEMMELADIIIEEGESYGVELEIPGVTTVLDEMTLEERIADDAAFLAGLHCSEEMIAEQQAMLDAASEE